MLAPLYLPIGQKKFVKRGTERTYLLGGLQIRLLTSVLGVLVAGRDLHFSAVNIGLHVRDQRIPTASTEETREHVKRIGMVLTSFVGFQTFL
jgi:hypothetical protein